MERATESISALKTSTLLSALMMNMLQGLEVFVFVHGKRRGQDFGPGTWKESV